MESPGPTSSKVESKMEDWTVEDCKKVLEDLGLKNSFDIQVTTGRTLWLEGLSSWMTRFGSFLC